MGPLGRAEVLGEPFCFLLEPQLQRVPTPSEATKDGNRNCWGKPEDEHYWEM